jgi:hypothetical protein
LSTREKPTAHRLRGRHLDNLETADALIRAGATVNSANDASATPLWLPPKTAAPQWWGDCFKRVPTPTWIAVRRLL